MIKKITHHQINQAIRFALKMNQIEEKKTSFLSSKRSLVKKDLIELVSNEKHLMLGHYKGLRMNGFIVCFQHPHQDFMDCAGPFYTEHQIGKSLIEEVIHQSSNNQNLIFFFDHRHQELIELIQSLGGHVQGNESQLILKRGQEKNLSENSQIQPYDMSYSSWLKTIHHQLFPDSYIAIDDVICKKDMTRHVYMIHAENQPIGYLILKSYPDFLQRKTIEMIGVNENYRHKGYGRALLSYAIRLSFKDPRVTSIDLIVENINANALNLYTHLGFLITRKNVNMMISSKTIR